MSTPNLTRSFEPGNSAATVETYATPIASWRLYLRGLGQSPSTRPRRASDGACAGAPSPHEPPTVSALAPVPAAEPIPPPKSPLVGRVAAPLALSFVELANRPRREHIVALATGGVLCGARGAWVAVVAGARRVCRACRRRAGAYRVELARGGRP